MKPWEKAAERQRSDAGKKRKRRSRIEARREGEDERLERQAEGAMQRREVKRRAAVSARKRGERGEGKNATAAVLDSMIGAITSGKK